MFDPKLKEALGRVQKPGRYTGGEPGSVYKDKEKVDVRFAFCFPDTYEVGMSFLGEKILYELLNSHENWWCERAFMPWLDMKAEMERLGLPLYTMESKDPLTAFDAVGFTLQYELSYTNILAMLDLAGIPFYSKDRDESWPLIVAGGPCACNAEPIADFFDVVQLGEGENQLPSICAEIEKAKKEGGVSKKELLLRIAKIPGVYIPAFYDVEYYEDGRVKAITPNEPGIPARITKAIIKDLNEFAPPTNFVVPMVGAIQDRASIEVLRGCVRGCRFCQAGFLYRPMRQRDASLLNKAAQDLCANTGYEELSLSSLSTSDHGQLEELLDDLNEWAPKEHVSLSLPSLRVDNFSQSLIEKTTKVRKSGLTFAAEAGSAGEAELNALGYSVTPVSAQSDALMEVAAGTSDAAVIDSLMAAAMVGEGTGYASLTYTCGLNSEEYGVGFRKGSDLAQKLNDFFKASYADGSMMQIAETYGVQAAIIEQK